VLRGWLTLVRGGKGKFNLPALFSSSKSQMADHSALMLIRVVSNQLFRLGCGVQLRI
jgi:hypothetical protein